MVCHFLIQVLSKAAFWIFSVCSGWTCGLWFLENKTLLLLIVVFFIWSHWLVVRNDDGCMFWIVVSMQDEFVIMLLGRVSACLSLLKTPLTPTKKGGGGASLFPELQSQTCIKTLHHASLLPADTHYCNSHCQVNKLPSAVTKIF